MSRTGQFNLSFPGASIICDSQEKREALLKYLNNENDSIETKVSFSCNDDAIYKAIYNTTYLHEGKHLHDHLVCPNLLHNYYLKLTSLFYSTLLYKAWNEGCRPYKYLPLPLTSWLKLSREVQLELIRKKGISADEVPLITIEDARALAKGQFQPQNEIDRYILYGVLYHSEYLSNISDRCPDSYNTEYSIKTFTESLAFIQQMTGLCLKYGNNGQHIVEKIVNDSFLHFMKLGKEKREEGKDLCSCDYIGYSTYTSMFTCVWRYAVQNQVNMKYIYPFISHVLFWALCGNIIEDQRDVSSPRNRLESILNMDYYGYDLRMNEDNRMQSLFKEPLKTFHDWDNYIAKAYRGRTTVITEQTGGHFHIKSGTTPIDLKRFYKTIISDLYQKTTYLKASGCNSAASYIENITAAIKHMTYIFSVSPTSYLHPEEYLKHLDYFVNVPFRIEFKDVPPVTSRDCDIIREDILFFDNCIYGNNLNRRNGNKAVIDCQLFKEAKMYIDLSDILFGCSDIILPGKFIKDNLPGAQPWFI